jgi:hypothetical protein
MKGYGYDAHKSAHICIHELWISIENSLNVDCGNKYKWEAFQVQHFYGRKMII